jgi:hypothetical protein
LAPGGLAPGELSNELAPNEPAPGALTPGERPASEYPPDERRGSELFGLPAMIFLLAIAAVVKGLFTSSLGFTIVGLVAAFGVLLAIGLAMTIAKRE